mgnify:CR=1 FL=1
MNLKTVIAASLLTLSAATAAYAGERDAYPQPSWDPTASDHLHRPAAPIGAAPIGAATVSLGDRMRATGSDTDYCVSEPYALNPRGGNNSHAGTC